jgi:hypothetical protein
MHSSSAWWLACWVWSAVLSGCSTQQPPPATYVTVEVLVGQQAKPTRVILESASLQDRLVVDELRSRGLEPDVDALSLVYEANPQLRDASIPYSGTLRLPRLQNPKAQGPAKIFVESKTKQELAGTAKALAGQVGQLRTVDPPPTWLGEVAEAVHEIARAAVSIESGSVALPRDVLRALLSEAQLLRRLLVDNAASQNLSTSDAALLHALRADLLARQSSYTQKMAIGNVPKAFPLAPVRVRTLGKTNGADVPRLRIYYVPVALDGVLPPESFDRLSSPAEDSLPEANYVFWAADATDMNRTPRTDRKPVSVRRAATGAQLVELVVSEH